MAKIVGRVQLALVGRRAVGLLTTPPPTHGCDGAGGAVGPSVSVAMSEQRPTQALDRLAQFEAVAPQPPSRRQARGRPGAQMAVSIVLPGAASMRRSPLIGLLAFVAGVAAPIAFAAWAFRQRDDLIGVALEPRFLTLVTALGLALGAEPAAGGRRGRTHLPRSARHLVAHGSRDARGGDARGAGAAVHVPCQRGTLGRGERVRRRRTLAVRAGRGGAGCRPGGGHERAAAGWRRGPRTVGHAHRHDDPRQHPRGEWSHRAGVDPAQPPRPAVAAGHPARRPGSPMASMPTTGSPTPSSPTSPATRC